MTQPITPRQFFDALIADLTALDPANASDSTYDDAIDTIRSIFLDPDEFPNPDAYDECAEILDSLTSAYLHAIRPDLFE